MKLGDIGEEMVATAVALAKEREATVEAIFVVRVPREFPLEGPLPQDVAERRDASLAEAQALGEDNDVARDRRRSCARSIGHAIVDEATRRGADLIVLGSSPRWRRQSRFFSPTVDHVLRHAPCQVLVVAFPEGSSRTAVSGLTRAVYAPRMKCSRDRLRSCRLGRRAAAGRRGLGRRLRGREGGGARPPRRWRGGFIVGHGMDSDVLRRAGIERGRRGRVVATDGDNTNIVIGQVLQKRYGIGCTVVRVLDPLRADFYASAACARCARRRRRSRC